MLVYSVHLSVSPSGGDLHELCQGRHAQPPQCLAGRCSLDPAADTLTMWTLPECRPAFALNPAACVLSQAFYHPPVFTLSSCAPELNKFPSPSVPKRGGLSTRLRVTGPGSSTSSLAESSSRPVVLSFAPGFKYNDASDLLTDFAEGWSRPEFDRGLKWRHGTLGIPHRLER